MYLVGLDLGQAADYTALTVLRRQAKVLTQKRLVPGTEIYEREPELAHSLYHCQLLERVIRMPYPDVIERILLLLSNPKLLQDGYRLIIDHGGPGAAVGDMLVDKGVTSIERIHTTAGDAATYANGVYRVSKKVLVGNMAIVLQSHRLKIAKDLPLAGALKNELLNFKMKITAKGNDTYEAASEQIHDDLVMAIMMALWSGERQFGEERVLKTAIREEVEEARAEDEGEYNILDWGSGERSYGDY